MLQVDSGHSRLQELRDSPPHYVFSAHGNNDQVHLQLLGISFVPTFDCVGCVAYVYFGMR